MMEITPATTFYALTAPVPGYTLGEQVLGPYTVHQWLKRYDHTQDGEYNLTCELENMADEGGIYTDETFAKQVLADGTDCVLRAGGRVEAFTPAELLNRLRLDAMEPKEE